MLQHHGGRLSYQGHEHKALKTHNTLSAGLSGRDLDQRFRLEVLIQQGFVDLEGVADD